MAKGAKREREEQATPGSPEVKASMAGKEDKAPNVLEDLFSSANVVPQQVEPQADVSEILKHPKKRRRQSKKEEALEGRQVVVVVSAKGLPTRTREEEEERTARTVFVGNLPNATTKEELESMFKRYGAVESARVRAQQFEGGDRGLFSSKKVNFIRKKLVDQGACCGFVVFAKAESVEKALELDGTMYKERRLQVDRAEGGADPFEPKDSLFLGNLLLEIDEEEIRSFFEGKGLGVKKVRVVRDPFSRKGKGFGFISFTSPEAMKQAFKLRGEELCGRELRMKHVKARSSQLDQRIRTKRQEVIIPKAGGKKDAKKRSRDDHVKGDAPVRHWEGTHASDKNVVPKKLSSLVTQWKPKAGAPSSAASKAKKMVLKEKRDMRKEKKHTATAAAKKKKD